MEALPRPVQGRTGPPAPRGHCDLRRPSGSSSATPRCRTRRWPFSPSCCSTRSWASSRKPARSPSVAALRQMAAAQAHVVRDGERRTVPAAEVVPGDIIVVEEGDTVPADARLIRTAALQTAESALTGESLPVAKDALRDRRRRRPRGPPQHGLQRDGRLQRARPGRGGGHRHAHGDGPHCRDAPGRPRGEDSAAEGARPRRPGARRGRGGHRGGDDRHHRPHGGGAGLRGSLRGPDAGSGAGGGGGARGPAHGGHGRPGPGRPASGPQARHRPPPLGGGDPRLGERRGLGQDRHPHPERDDRARGGHGQWPGAVRGHRLRARGRRAA